MVSFNEIMINQPVSITSFNSSCWLS